ncbi:MAG: hypothetical protein D8M54_21370 [Chloroflexi bacterium]|nr:hypothetical protein [Chloroflexota bacterium]
MALLPNSFKKKLQLPPTKSCQKHALDVLCNHIPKGVYNYHIYEQLDMSSYNCTQTVPGVVPKLYRVIVQTNEKGGYVISKFNGYV